MTTGTAQNYHQVVNSLLFGGSDSDSDSDVEIHWNNPTVTEQQTDEIECGACFCEYPPEKVTRCYANHTFCLDCAKKNAEAELGKSRWVVQCMDITGCKADFPRREMLRFVESKTIAVLDKIKIDAALKGVGVDDLIARCPYCEYVIICGTIEEKSEVECTNPECLKWSCRLCRGEMHPDMSCEEYGKRNEARLTIEEMITRAVIRKCNNCGTAFIKEEGCNKITCPRCNNYQCYLCSDNITGYDHFGVERENGKICNIYDDGARRTQYEIAQVRDQAVDQTHDRDLQINLDGLDN